MFIDIQMCNNNKKKILLKKEKKERLIFLTVENDNQPIDGSVENNCGAAAAR